MDVKSNNTIFSTLCSELHGLTAYQVDKILNELDFSNTSLSICCSKDTNLNILTSSYIKSLKGENIFCCSYETQYNNLLNSQNIITFNPWNIPTKLNSFWRK